eukprot:1563415-Rhodomonas_salina.1
MIHGEDAIELLRQRILLAHQHPDVRPPPPHPLLHRRQLPLPAPDRLPRSPHRIGVNHVDTHTAFPARTQSVVRGAVAQSLVRGAYVDLDGVRVGVGDEGGEEGGEAGRVEREAEVPEEQGV